MATAMPKTDKATVVLAARETQVRQTDEGRSRREPFEVSLDSADLHDPDVLLCAEVIAREGGKVGMTVRIDAPDDTPASYGSSEPLRAACLANSEVTR